VACPKARKEEGDDGLRQKDRKDLAMFSWWSNKVLFIFYNKWEIFSTGYFAYFAYYKIKIKLVIFGKMIYNVCR
jgi:hypothetical protein